jgi:hypothetical protein
MGGYEACIDSVYGRIISLEAFTATEFSEIFSGRQPRQDVKVLVQPNHQHTLKMGTELVPETSVNLQILTQLFAPVNAVVMSGTLPKIRPDVGILTQ